MRVPLGAYLTRGGVRVHSLVVEIPFSPIDLDVGHLARGEWNPACDRFRIWYLPKNDVEEGTPLCYVMVRKLDPRDTVVVYAHIVVNLGASEKGSTFTVGILSNDDVRARSTLNSMFDIPPSFHRRSEVGLIERKWRDDPEALSRFVANVYSAAVSLRGGAAHSTMKVEMPPAAFSELRRNIGTWWEKGSA